MSLTLDLDREPVLFPTSGQGPSRACSFSWAKVCCASHDVDRGHVLFSMTLTVGVFCLAGEQRGREGAVGGAGEARPHVAVRPHQGAASETHSRHADRGVSVRACVCVCACMCVSGWVGAGTCVCACG